MVGNNEKSDDQVGTSSMILHFHDSIKVPVYERTLVRRFNYERSKVSLR